MSFNCRPQTQSSRGMKQRTSDSPSTSTPPLVNKHINRIAGGSTLQRPSTPTFVAEYATNFHPRYGNKASKRMSHIRGVSTSQSNLLLDDKNLTGFYELIKTHLKDTPDDMEATKKTQQSPRIISSKPRSSSSSSSPSRGHKQIHLTNTTSSAHTHNTLQQHLPSSYQSPTTTVTNTTASALLSTIKTYSEWYDMPTLNRPLSIHETLPPLQHLRGKSSVTFNSHNNNINLNATHDKNQKSTSILLHTSSSTSRHSSRRSTLSSSLASLSQADNKKRRHTLSYDHGEDMEFLNVLKQLANTNDCSTTAASSNRSLRDENTIPHHTVNGMNHSVVVTEHHTNNKNMNVNVKPLAGASPVQTTNEYQEHEEQHHTHTTDNTAAAGGPPHQSVQQHHSQPPIPHQPPHKRIDSANIYVVRKRNHRNHNHTTTSTSSPHQYASTQPLPAVTRPRHRNISIDEQLKQNRSQLINDTYRPYSASSEIYTIQKKRHSSVSNYPQMRDTRSRQKQEQDNTLTDDIDVVGRSEGRNGTVTHSDATHVSYGSTPYRSHYTPHKHDKLISFWLTEEQTADVVAQLCANNVHDAAAPAYKPDELMVSAIESHPCSGVVLMNRYPLGVRHDDAYALQSLLTVLLGYDSQHVHQLASILQTLPTVDSLLIASDIYQAQAHEMVHQLRSIGWEATVVTIPQSIEKHHEADAAANNTNNGEDTVLESPLGIVNGKLALPPLSRHGETAVHQLHTIMYSIHHCPPRNIEPMNQPTQSQRTSIYSTSVHPTGKRGSMSSSHSSHRSKTSNKLLYSQHPSTFLSSMWQSPNDYIRRHLYWVRKNEALKEKVTQERKTLAKINKLESKLRKLQYSATLPAISNDTDKHALPHSDNAFSYTARLPEDQKALIKRLSEDLQNTLKRHDNISRIHQKTSSSQLSSKIHTIEEDSASPTAPAKVDKDFLPRVATLIPHAPKPVIVPHNPPPIPVHPHVSINIPLSPRQKALARPKEYTLVSHEPVEMHELIKSLPPLPSNSSLLLTPAHYAIDPPLSSKAVSQGYGLSLRPKHHKAADSVPSVSPRIMKLKKQQQQQAESQQRVTQISERQEDRTGAENKNTGPGDVGQRSDAPAEATHTEEALLHPDGVTEIAVAKLAGNEGDAPQHRSIQEDSNPPHADHHRQNACITQNESEEEASVMMTVQRGAPPTDIAHTPVGSTGHESVAASVSIESTEVTASTNAEVDATEHASASMATTDVFIGEQLSTDATTSSGDDYEGEHAGDAFYVSSPQQLDATVDEGNVTGVQPQDGEVVSSSSFAYPSHMTKNNSTVPSADHDVVDVQRAVQEEEEQGKKSEVDGEMVEDTSGYEKEREWDEENVYEDENDFTRNDALEIKMGEESAANQRHTHVDGVVNGQQSDANININSSSNEVYDDIADETEEHHQHHIRHDSIPATVIPLTEALLKLHHEEHGDSYSSSYKDDFDVNPVSADASNRPTHNNIREDIEASRQTPGNHDVVDAESRVRVVGGSRGLLAHRMNITVASDGSVLVEMYFEIVHLSTDE